MLTSKGDHKLRGPPPKPEQVDKALTAHTWYHGLIPRKEVEDMLKIQGDYLVRKTTVARQITYCLSVKHTSDTKHVPLGYSNGTWTLKDVSARHISFQSPKDHQICHPSFQVDKALTAHTWYHGLIPRKEVEDMLKIQGDYLVRKTTVARQITYCLSVKHTSDTKHVPLGYSNGTWTLKDISKPSLKELIDELVQTAKPIPPSGVILKTPFPRPDYYFLHEHITILKKLGHGEFGEVNLGKLRLKNDEEIDVAVKMLRGTRIKKAQLSAFFEEAKLMRRFDHPNIVRFYGVAPQEEPIMIILELASGGSLKNYCKTHADIPDSKLIQFATDGARGMCYLAARQVIHRDLAARNCLLGQKDELKISDFGLSIADKTEMKMDKLKSVPIKWLAPETLRQGLFSTKTDVWSFGVLLWEIFARCASDPFPGETNAKAKEHILHDPAPMSAPEGSPPIVQEVMDVCFVKVGRSNAVQTQKRGLTFVKVLKLLAPDEKPPTIPLGAFQTY
ncbi:SH2 domain protein [Ostertagia ostertagi]